MYAWLWKFRDRNLYIFDISLRQHGPSHTLIYEDKKAQLIAWQPNAQDIDMPKRQAIRCLKVLFKDVYPIDDNNPQRWMIPDSDTNKQVFAQALSYDF